MILANGDNPAILLDILNGKEIGTLFIENNNIGELNMNE